MAALTKPEWYDKVADYIVDNLMEFYTKFYPDSEPKNQGKQIAIEPCPSCGHRGSCKATPVGLNCFSCKWTGTHISALTSHYTNNRNKTYGDAIRDLEEFTGEKFPAESPEEIEANRKHQRQQDILRRAAEFYHSQLMLRKTEYDFRGIKMTPLDYLIRVRKRSIDSIGDFKVGFSANWLELRMILLNSQFTEEEIDEAKVRIPEGLIVYFYHHHKTKEIIHYNTKNPFGVKINPNATDPIAGYSYGPKVLLYAPKFSFKEPVFLVEGENDLMSVYESGYTNVACLGGRPSDETLSVLEKCESEIYTAFDHDSAGDAYLETINRLFPEKIIKKVHFPEEFNDIDEYYVNSIDGQFDIKKLMASAEEISTTEFKIRRINNNVWEILNRYQKLEFVIKKRTDSRALVGQISLYSKDGTLIDREEDKSLISCKANKKPMNFKLADAIKSHFDEELEKRSFEELASLYWNSTHQQFIITLLAQQLFEAEDKEPMVMRLRELLSDLPNNRDIVDNVLKELNDIQNRALPKHGELRKMQFSQFFSIKNNDAYFYFINTKNDVDARRRIPYFLRNDKSLIRLDLIKRKDPQCLLLIDNKYELPEEAPTSPIEQKFCSLTQTWVERYVANEIDPQELEPRFIIKTLEEFIKRFYFHNDDSVYKVLAMWAYGTYLYDMFKVFPYIYINGEKGAGKSALGKTLEMIAFNARVIVQTSEASLFRTASIEGGTLVLDEQETLTSRKKGVESGFGPIIKGGYTKGQNVARFNLDKKALEYFDPYCPKVIINIMGLDDIIGDRCIEIKSYRIKVNKDFKIEDPARFQDEHIDEYREISSKCCLSALENFQTLNTIYDQGIFVTGNARLSQILNPILAISKLADIKERAETKQNFPDLADEQIIGEYETAFNHFYNTYVLSSKAEIEDSTQEGIIKKIVSSVAKELYLHVPDVDRKFTNMGHRKYNEAIAFDLNAPSPWFEINVLHFKTFIEEFLPGEYVTSRMLTRSIKSCFDIKPADCIRRETRIENEALSQELNGNTTTRIYYYRFYFREFIQIHQQDIYSGPVEEKTAEEIKKNLF